MASKSEKRDPKAPDPQTPAWPFANDGDEAPGQNIWLAGLGALAEAQAEGSKAFEALVKQGMQMQAQAKEQMTEAAERLSAMTGQSTGSGNWNRLGGIFENRVAQALASMGMPSATEVAELRDRVEALEKALAASGGEKAPAKKTAKKT